MLCLSRWEDESIVIGDNIEIKVISVVHGKVRLGISAPADVPVHRKEVYERIQRENDQAAGLLGL